MTDVVCGPAEVPAARSAVRAGLRGRRVAFGFLTVGSALALTAWLIAVVASDGIGLFDLLLIVWFVAYMPCLLIPFWNSAIGFFVLETRRGASALHKPRALMQGDEHPGKIAIAMVLRNEDASRALAHFRSVEADLAAAECLAPFDFVVLSDSSDPAIIAAEEREFGCWRAESPSGRLFYRRRLEPVGYKGGNVYDFCTHAGKDYDLLVLLDADSLMSARLILRLVYEMRSHPRLGMLQSRSVGLPSTGLFTRILQFGLRHVMRCGIAGANWWQGDCCQFWGHNCVIRVAPYRDHCRIPAGAGAPAGGFMCHDQLEAALMHRAGYEIRFMDEEPGSYEDNPPTLPDYLRRHRRWCKGNLENLRLLGGLSLTTISRVHLWFVAQKFLASLALCAFVIVAAVIVLQSPASEGPAPGIVGLYLTFMILHLGPRLFGAAHVLLRERESHGGTARVVLGSSIEMVFTLLLVPIHSAVASAFILKYPFGDDVRWDGQQRENHEVSWRAAAAELLLPTGLGLALLLALAIGAPSAAPWFMPFLVGLLFGIPIATLTSSTSFGAWAAERQICAVPEELVMPPEIRRYLEALARRA